MVRRWRRTADARQRPGQTLVGWRRLLQVRRVRRLRRLRSVGRMRGPGGVFGLVMALVASLAFALGAPHGAAVAHADDGELRPRLEAACARIPTAQGRLEAAIDRLDGGAEVRGSLAWFEAAIDRATAAGRQRLADDLAGRLDRLTDRRAQLDVRIGQLERLRQRCAELGVPA